MNDKTTLKTNPDDSVNPTFGPTETFFPKNSDFAPLMESKGGLTKREYFAARALQGLSGNPKLKEDVVICDMAIALSDELIQKLNKEKK